MVLNQLVFFLIGYLFLFLFYKIGPNFFRLNSRFFYLISLFLVGVTLFSGVDVRGSRRWLDLYIVNFQPSEFFKLFFILYLCQLFSVEKKVDFEKIAFSFLIFIIPALVIFKQPDLGNTAVYTAIYLSILFFSAVPISYFLYSLAFFILFIPVSWRVLKDYQRARILSFINPQIDPEGISYNLIQSIIAVGSGTFFGRGLARGTQSRFLFLPESYTDFAFASLTEQFGFLGASLVIFLYGVLIFRIIKKAFRLRKERYIFLFLTAVSTMLTVEIFVNIGMNLGLLPITGIALPLISYGGSSIVSTLMTLGLVFSL